MLKISMIIPAAGLSCRHPPNKLLIEMKGMTVIENTISKFVDFPLDIIVVIGYQKNRISAKLRNRFGERIHVVNNPEYATGMASSLKTGINIIGFDCDYYGFCNGDKPFIAKETVSILLEMLNLKKPAILAPSYGNQTGHPAFFAASLRSELLTLEGDIGGREVMNNHKKETMIHPVDDEGVILDMDRYLELNNV